MVKLVKMDVKEKQQRRQNVTKARVLLIAIMARMVVAVIFAIKMRPAVNVQHVGS